MKQFAIITLGCKVNQCESAALGKMLESRGCKMAMPRDQKDLVVLNTCTVTGKAAMQSRQAIRQAIRNNPDAKIVVTGCYAQTAPEEIRNIQGIDCIVGHGDKLGIPEIVTRITPQSPKPVIIHQNILQARCFAPLPSAAPENRTRAFLKIQDGCDTFCTYCIVPHARGRSRSMPFEDVLAHLNRLTDRNYREVVLTGIHLGAYGKDLEPQTTLVKLLKAICWNRSGHRIRISSIEPTEVTPQIISLMADTQSPLCPHFHIPLQSGDSGILKRMGRPYSTEQFHQIIREIHHRLPHAAIGMDILVGFPGENEAAFNRTVTLIKQMPVSYLHVFPFSPRKGTPAAGFKGKISERIIKERCGLLRQLGEEKKKIFYLSNIGRKVNVLIETAESGRTAGISENYIPVLISDARPTENTLVKVRIEKVAQDLTVAGKII